MNFVTIENFDESKLSVGEIYSATKPIQYQKIPLYYEYPSGKGPVVLRTPVLFSLGVFENRSFGNERAGRDIPCPFLGFNEKNGMNEKEKKFIETTEKISKFLRGKSQGNDSNFEKRRKNEKNNDRGFVHF
jgi:hypothetical protein